MIYTPQKFSDDTGVSIKVAKKILDIVYEKELNAEDLNAVLWRVRTWFIKNKLPDLMEKMDKATIETVVDELIADRNRYACPEDICCAETAEELEAAFNSLSEDRSAWFFSVLSFKDQKKQKFKAGDVVTIQIMRTGSWDHQVYGKFDVSSKDLKEVKKNFDENRRGVELAVDENHEENHVALGWFKKLELKNKDTELYAEIELTKKGADLLTEGAYKYFSPEIAFVWTDEETGDKIRNLLIGGAFTNRPFFKNMQPLMANEAADDKQTNRATGPTLLLFSQPEQMEKLLRLIAQFSAKSSINAEQKAEIEAAFKEIPADKVDPKIKTAYEDIVGRYSEEGGEGEGGDSAPAEGEEGAAPAEGDEPNPDEGEGEGSEGGEGTEELPEGVQANEDGTFTVNAQFFDGVKSMQSTVTKLQAQSRKAQFSEKLRKFKFSESNKAGFILPKNFQEVVNFTATLSEKKANEFIALVGKFNAVGGAMGFSVDDDVDMTKVQLTEADPMVQHFMEKLGQDVEKAKQSAKYYYEEKAKKNA